MGPQSNRTSGLIHRKEELSLYPHTITKERLFEHTVREGAICKPRRGSPPERDSCWHPDLRLLAFRTVRKFLLFKLPGLWYFIMVARAD